jgi:hypothetical protein
MMSKAGNLSLIALESCSSPVPERGFGRGFLVEYFHVRYTTDHPSQTACNGHLGSHRDHTASHDK